MQANVNVTKDKNGNYYFNGERMLVSYMRGDHRLVKNPIQVPWEPSHFIEYYPGPVGVVVAFYFGNELRYGFSKTNIWRGDKFNREIGITTAVERAMLKNIQPPFENVTAHDDIRDALDRMYGRTKNYFKGQLQGV